MTSSFLQSLPPGLVMIAGGLGFALLVATPGAGECVRYGAAVTLRGTV